MTDMHGRQALVTGANTGIGRATATELARRGASVVIACRSEAKALPVVDDIVEQTGNADVRFHPLDLANLAATRRSAEALLADGRPIDLLVNNAGVAGQRGLTDDDFELTFGVNHLGHFLFTTVLMPLLVESGPTRIVNVSSGNHLAAKGIDWGRLQQRTKTITGLREYNVSKLCNVLFTQELCARFGADGITAMAVNPGPVASDVWRSMPPTLRKVFLAVRKMKTNEEGAQPSLRAACDPDLPPATYLDQDSQPRAVNPLATPALAAELWARSESWVAVAGGGR